MGADYAAPRAPVDVAARRRRDDDGCARPAAVGGAPRPALRLQRRRERPFRPASDRALRPRLEPALLREPPGADVSAAPGLRRLVRRRPGHRPRLRAATRARSSRWRGWPRRSCRWPRCRCCASPGPACSAAPPASSPARCWPSRSCRCSTRTRRSTTRPVLTPLALALYGAAGVLRHGAAPRLRTRGRRPRAGVGDEVHRGDRGLPLLAAAFAGAGSRPLAARRLGSAWPSPWRPPFAAQPYAVLDASDFLAGLRHQAGASGAAKLGITEDSGHVYYLWTLTWGLGWVPALGGARRRAAPPPRDRRVAAVLRPGAGALLVYMGLQERYFGRWLMPALPFLCLLAAAGASRSCGSRPRGGARPAGRWRPRRCAPRASCSACTATSCSAARTPAPRPALDAGERPWRVRPWSSSRW